MDKPFSPACERNREPILEVIRPELVQARNVLEIGSGTGQHAVYFAAAMPDLKWQTSDLPENHAGINAWISESGLANVLEPLALDVGSVDHWPDRRFDAVYTANTCHIMSWAHVQSMFSGTVRVLEPGSVLVVYGPFNRAGEFTSEGNRSLDAWARERFPGGGLRDESEIVELGASVGLELGLAKDMPANNRLLVLKTQHAASGEPAPRRSGS